MGTTYTATGTGLPRRAPRRTPRFSSPVLGMGFFIGTELMFFVSLISSYLVIRAGQGDWIPPANVRLPVLATGFNTFVLLLSGYLIWKTGQLLVLGRTHRAEAQKAFLQSILLGGFFVLFQGYEWVKLISLGMTLHTGIFSACFFLLIGSHGLHALVTILTMVYYYPKLGNGTITLGGFRALQMFWLFVVGMWPLLYGLVYFKW